MMQQQHRFGLPHACVLCAVAWCLSTTLARAQAQEPSAVAELATRGVAAGPAAAARASAETPSAESTPSPAESAVPEGTKTLGGKQFWTDYLAWPDWRVQRNAVSGHYRLLDGRNRRHASGSFQHCKERLEELVAQSGTEPVTGSVVLILHGIGDTRQTMQAVEDALSQDGGFTPISLTYASTRGGVADHARALASVVKHLPNATELSFVGYSMGSLVIRHFWHDMQTAGRAEVDPRIRRIVMLAPPNHGAQLAVRLSKNNLLYDWVLGESGNQLGEDWESIAGQLATPSCEFGIIAGCGPAWSPGNPLVEGANDHVVAVSETRLAGAADFCILPVTHNDCPRDARVIECTLNFLKHGYFVSADDRRPIRPESVPLGIAR